MSDLIVTRNQSASHSSAEIQACLEHLAINSGNVRRTEDERKAAGLPVPSYSTLQRWKTKTYPDEYARIAEEVVGRVYAEMAEANERVAREALEGELKGAERLNAMIPAIEDPVDLSRTVLNLSKTKGIASQNASIQRGRPTEITAKVSAAELAKAMASRFPGIVNVVESTATDMEEEAT